MMPPRGSGERILPFSQRKESFCRSSLWFLIRDHSEGKTGSASQNSNGCPIEGAKRHEESRPGYPGYPGIAPIDRMASRTRAHDT